MMPDYETMYHMLFNAVTDALRQVEEMNFGMAGEILRQVQIACEEMYVAEADG